jgi:hypothetical protein
VPFCHKASIAAVAPKALQKALRGSLIQINDAARQVMQGAAAKKREKGRLQ